MEKLLEISLLGTLRVRSDGRTLPLPTSRKTRALLAFLVSTQRPHRRERLCELLWDLPDDPKASLRWALSKLRKVVDSPQNTRIIADRERVLFDGSSVEVDIRKLRSDFYQGKNFLSSEKLENMASQLGQGLLEGLEGSGVARFDSWLRAERQEAQTLRGEILQLLSTKFERTPTATDKWFSQWQPLDSATAVTSKSNESSNKFVSEKHGFEVCSPIAEKTDDLNPMQEISSPTEFTLALAELWTPSPEVKTHTNEALNTQKIQFCEVRDGTKIAYATLGSGAPLLKAANWLSHLEFDWNSPIWGKSFAEIARKRTFVRYDERGCGLSDWDVDDLSFNAFVEDLETVADTVGLERFPLLGISQGCAVAIEYAVRHPHRVSGLVLFGGYAAGWRHHASVEEQALRETMMTLTELGWGKDNPAYRQVFSQTFMPEASAKDLDWFNEFQRLTTSPYNAARFQDAFGHIDVRHRLADVQAPTIVLHSKYDQRIPIELGREVASGIPGAYFVPLESRNHILVNHEPAWKVCIETVAQFLDEHHL